LKWLGTSKLLKEKNILLEKLEKLLLMRRILRVPAVRIMFSRKRTDNLPRDPETTRKNLLLA
jgi:hypothetical protein